MLNRQAEYQKRYKKSKKGQTTQRKYYRSKAKKKENKRWRSNNRKEVKMINKRWYHKRGGKLIMKKYNLKAHYGLSLKDYEKILEKQDNKCACCGIDFKHTPGYPSIDHNHETDEIRGILCTNCNLGLGNFHDDISKLQRAIDYLVNF